VSDVKSKVGRSERNATRGKTVSDDEKFVSVERESGVNDGFDGAGEVGFVHIVVERFLLS
jgi:hypothetical protein